MSPARPRPRPVQPRNRLTRRTYRLFDAAEAIASQHGNLTAEKLDIAVRQAFSMWSAVAQLEFIADPNGAASPNIPITFSHFGESDAQLGNGTVQINIDQDFFVDKFDEKDPRPVRTGPFDLVRAIAHEIGHKLGLDHPPAGDPQPAVMSAGQGEQAVLRQMFPFDIANITRLFGAIQLTGEVPARLEDSALVDSASGVTFSKSNGGVVVGGPNGASALVDCFVAVKGSTVNSIKLKFNTVSRNVIVHRAELWDGFVRLQTYSLASKAESREGLHGKQFDYHFGLVPRRKMQNALRVRFALRFLEEDRGVNGVAILQSVKATLLSAGPVLSRVRDHR